MSDPSSPEDSTPTPQPDPVPTPRPEPERVPGREEAAARPSAQASALPPMPPFGYPPVPSQFPSAPQAAGKRPSGFKHGFGLGAGVGLGFGASMLVLTVVSTVLGMISMMAFGAMASSLASSSPGSVDSLKTVWGADGAASTFRAIPVRGAIQASGSDGLFSSGGVYGYEVAEVLDALTTDDADGVVLMMNTPGGSVPGSLAISKAIDRYRERTGHKVFAFVEDMSASGGMYTMAGADKIIGAPGSLVGSIGVRSGPYLRYRDVTSSGSMLGGSVTAREITSEYITAGKGKDAGNPFRDMTPEERAREQQIVDDMYEDFVTHVLTKRNIPRERIVGEAGAAMFTGQRAIDIGYLDAIMDRDEALRNFATEAGFDPANTNMVESSGPASWTSLFGIQQRPWGVSPAATAPAGQTPKVTAKLCADPTTPLVLHGTLDSVCG
ncbi:MAG: S49 family peptidase [Propioniciclava sp.]|uniref:S49 family peptidase n=1 Tax=Propioniciclava sp. TaxID=2038686 RepID=UPI0039E34ABB